MTALTDFSATTLTGDTMDFSELAGSVVLVVNTASECGFTPQYEGLEKLYQDYREQGLVVVGFPCNQFGGQEPGDGEQIGAVCRSTFGVTFPMMAKVEVNGGAAHPLFRWLRREKRGILGSRINWNFTKFLIGRDGRVISRHGPSTTPDALRHDIERALAS